MERIEVRAGGRVVDVHLVWLGEINTWRDLLSDGDWCDLTEGRDKPFALMTVSDDPTGDVGSWAELAAHLTQSSMLQVSSWGANSSVLDDLFDMAAVMGCIDGRLTNCPLTTWHDNETVAQALEYFFETSALGPEDPAGSVPSRVVLVVGPTDRTAEIRQLLRADPTG